MNYKYLKLVLLVLVLSGVTLVSGQTVTESSTLEKSFRVNPDMVLEVTNKYGKVHLSKSNDDSVHVAISMTASAKNKQKVRKLTDGISFELSATNYHIIAKTNFNRGPVSLFENLRSLTNNIVSLDSRIEINYIISVPEYLEVKIDMRYGDIYLESSNSNMTLYHSNGNFRAEELTGNVQLDLSFSDVTIASMAKADIKVAYSDLSIDYSESLDINSVSSEIELGTVVELRSNSKRDRFKIDKLSRISGQSYFTNYTITIFFNELDLSTRYGLVDILKLEADFGTVDIESSYTDVVIRTPEDASFSIDIKVSNCPSVIPEEWLLDETVVNEDKREYLYFGNIGNPSGKSQILLRVTRGSLALF